MIYVASIQGENVSVVTELEKKGKCVLIKEFFVIFH